MKNILPPSSMYVASRAPDPVASFDKMTEGIEMTHWPTGICSTPSGSMYEGAVIAESSIDSLDGVTFKYTFFKDTVFHKITSCTFENCCFLETAFTGDITGCTFIDCFFVGCSMYTTVYCSEIVRAFLRKSEIDRFVSKNSGVSLVLHETTISSEICGDIQSLDMKDCNAYIVDSNGVLQLVDVVACVMEDSTTLFKLKDGSVRNGSADFICTALCCNIEQGQRVMEVGCRLLLSDKGADQPVRCSFPDFYVSVGHLSAFLKYKGRFDVKYFGTDGSIVDHVGCCRCKGVRVDYVDISKTRNNQIRIVIH